MVAKQGALGPGETQLVYAGPVHCHRAVRWHRLQDQLHPFPSLSQLFAVDKSQIAPELHFIHL